MMKKVFTMLLACLSLGIYAQDFKTSVQLNAGISLVGKIIETSDDFGGNHSTYAPPAIQLNIDRKLANWFSIGLAGSYQIMGIEYKGNTDPKDNFKNDITRSNIAIRTLFHYGSNPDINFYSGLRYGVTHWTAKTTSTDPDYDPTGSIVGDLTNPGIQVVLFGLRGYFTDHFGINAEFCIGSPHYLSMGLSYRF